MNTKTRLDKLETTILQKQIKTLTDNIEKVSDNDLILLGEIILNEKVRRGLITSPEIQAGRALYGHLIEKGMTKADALTQALATAAANGYELNELDILMD